MVATAVLPTLRGRAALGSAQKGHADKSWATGLAAITQVGPGAQACDDPNLGHNRSCAVVFPIRFM